MTKETYAIGIDIGGTKVMGALVSSSGRILQQFHIPTEPVQGPHQTITRIVEATRALTATADGLVQGVGVACAGILNPQDNSIIYAANLGWRDVPLGAALSHGLALPVLLGNDATLAAAAEYMWGSPAKVEDLIYVTVSTGIGAGIISGGKLIRGVTDGAGELGHISVNPHGERCGCGNYGCLENYSSGTAIAAAANEDNLMDGKPHTAKEICQLAAAGHPAATAIIQRAAFYLGNGVTTLLHLFNPRRIVFGGGVMEGSELLLAETKKIIEDRALPGMREGVTITRTTLGKEIGVLGAAGHWFMTNEAKDERG